MKLGILIMFLFVQFEHKVPFVEFKKEVRLHWANSDYNRSIALLEEGKKIYLDAEEQHTILYYLGLVYIENNDLENSIKSFEEGFDKGFFFSIWPAYREKLEADKKGQETLTSNDAIQRKFNSDSEIKYEVLRPDDYDKDYSILYFFHGNNSNLESLKAEWAKVDLETLAIAVVLVQSPFARSNYTFDWQDNSKSMEAIKRLHPKIMKHLPQEPKHTFVGGFSNGGRMSIITYLSQPFAIDGFLAFNPSIPDKLEGRIPSTRKAAVGAMGAVVTGDNDYLFEAQSQMYSLLEERRFRMRWKVLPNQGHEYPERFEQELLASLQFLRLK